MLYEATGKIHEIFETQQKTDNFKLREFVLEIEDGQYTQQIKFQLTQDRCSLLDKFSNGDEVKVAFSLRGRAYTNKEGKTMYFTNLNAVKLEPAGDTAEDPNANQVPPEESDPNVDADHDEDAGYEEDIPF